MSSVLLRSYPSLLGMQIIRFDTGQPFPTGKHLIASTETKWVIDMSAPSYKMANWSRLPLTWLIFRSELVWVIKRSISSFSVYKNLKSVIDSAVLHWTTRLKVFPRNVGFGRCYLVSTRHEILFNIDRNAKPNRNSAAAPKKPEWNKSRESADPTPAFGCH